MNNKSAKTVIRVVAIVLVAVMLVSSLPAVVSVFFG